MARTTTNSAGQSRLNPARPAPRPARALEPPVVPCANGGFTLVDLALSVLILGILAMVALPRFTGITASAALDESARELSAALEYARVLAIENQRPFGLTASLSLNRFEVFDSRPAATGLEPSAAATVPSPLTHQSYVVDLDETPSCRGARLFAVPAASRVLFYPDGHTAEATAQAFVLAVGAERRTVSVDGMTGVVTVR
jgi:Tfp pilus assembly protein FimT